MREDIQAFGKHWYDDLNLGGSAFFGGENKSFFCQLRTSRIQIGEHIGDFKQSPSRIYKLTLEVVGLLL